MSSSDTSDVEMKPRRRIKRKNSMDGQYRPSMEGKVPPKPKQRGAPKRPISAYFLYAADVREEFKTKNPDLKMTALTKLIAAQWKKEDDDTKEPYLEDAKKNKEEYTVKRAEYVASNKYKKWKKDVAEWNDRHKEEWLDQEEARKEKNEERRKKRADKAKKAKKGSSGDEDKENKKKSKNNKEKKKTTNKRRGRKKSK